MYDNADRHAVLLQPQTEAAILGGRYFAGVHQKCQRRASDCDAVEVARCQYGGVVVWYAGEEDAANNDQKSTEQLQNAN